MDSTELGESSTIYPKFLQKCFQENRLKTGLPNNCMVRRHKRGDKGTKKHGTKIITNYRNFQKPDTEHEWKKLEFFLRK